MTDTASLLATADLTGLRQVFAARVREEPWQARHRLDLADILIVQGELERADGHLALASEQDTALALPVALTRQLLRAATARVETFEQRRVPDPVAEPDAVLAAALARLAGVEDAPAPSPVAATVDGGFVTAFLDLDDRTADVLELLTSTGKYVWVPFSQIAALKVRRPERLRDIVWRPAELEVRGGPTGVVYLPAIYHGGEGATDAHRLGRATDWIEDGDRATGIGLRSFLVDDDAIALGDFAELGVAA
jgi:type VI secretion system protein ImpE